MRLINIATGSRVVDYVTQGLLKAEKNNLRCAPIRSILTSVRTCVRACERVSVRACVMAWVHVGVGACVHVCSVCVWVVVYYNPMYILMSYCTLAT